MANKINNKAVDPVDAIIDQIGVTPASFSSNISSKVSNKNLEKSEKLKSVKSEEGIAEAIAKPIQASIRSISEKESESKVESQINEKKSSKKKKPLSHSEYLKDYRKGKKNILISELLYKELLYHKTGITVSKSINIILAEYLMEAYPSCRRKMEKFLKNI